VPDVLERPATHLRDLSRASITNFARAGGRIVALGERGAILLSDDEGQTWRQAEVPVNVTLTAAAFPTPHQGWAVGHGGVVLQTTDGGENWALQLDGRKIAALATSSAGSDPAAHARALQLAGDGPDKPLLDLCFDGTSTGYVVGAYGLMLGTSDGGRSWTFLSERLDNPKSLHLNAIRCEGKLLTIVGEQGLLLRSRDGSASFQQLTSPYRGSFFGVLTAGADDIVTAGLRGNAFRSQDGGTTWQPLALGAPASFTVVASQRDGSWLLANQAGQVFSSTDQGRSFRPVTTSTTARLSAALTLADGALLVGTPTGISRTMPNSAQLPKPSR
jgi:photosystem II stability/assembly factor-like uncharacterized protein